MDESMMPVDLVSVVVRFNDRINAHDAEGLAELMTENHRFIDSAGNVTTGRQQMRNGWQSFFDAWPDYRNIFKQVLVLDDSQVNILGRSYCAEKSLDGPAIWIALVDNGQIDQWRILEDIVETRKELGLAASTVLLHPKRP